LKSLGSGCFGIGLPLWLVSLTLTEALPERKTPSRQPADNDWQTGYSKTVKNRNANELTVCGRKAVDKLVKVHPERVVRMFFNKDMAPRYGEICRKLAASKRIYRLVEDAELEKVAGSVHHGGVAAVIDLPRMEEPGPLEIGAWVKESRRLLILDNVANSLNLGTMVRTASFMGLGDILVTGQSDDHLITTSMYRTAEGGMEYIRLWQVADLVQFMERFGKGMVFVAADHRANLDLRQVPAKLASLGVDTPAGAKAVAMIMGNEETGLSAEVRQRCQLAARITGGGDLDSLNVAQAAAIFMFALGKTV
jgi:TrmH RNA methyltransferase